MKKRIIAIIMIVIVTVSSFIIYGHINKIYENKLQKEYEALWLIYDNNVETIKNNMDLIAMPHEKFPWSGFKETKQKLEKNDKYLLDGLVSIITDCYIEFAGLDNIYTHAGEILKYRDDPKGFKFYTESMCTTSFNIFSFSDYALDNEINPNFADIIRELRDFNSKYGYTYKSQNYKEYLTYRVMETSYISRLSDALVIEYYHLNNDEE